MHSGHGFVFQAYSRGHPFSLFKTLDIKLNQFASFKTAIDSSIPFHLYSTDSRQHDWNVIGQTIGKSLLTGSGNSLVVLN